MNNQNLPTGNSISEQGPMDGRMLSDILPTVERDPNPEPTLSNMEQPCRPETQIEPCIPSNMRNVNITQLHRGYVVKIDCHSFAIGTKEELITKLTDYINAPADTEKKWFAGQLF